MQLDPVLVWFLVGLALALAELVVPGVILIFFAGGAWIASGTTYLELTPTLPSQLLTFTIASLGLLLGLREWVHGALYGHVAHSQDPDANLDEFRGRKVILLKDVGPGRTESAVEHKGAPWAVIADEKFRQGDEAYVSGVEGVALKITRQKEE
jgi:membrane protein implicated in regulation of membrane protease activity